MIPHGIDSLLEGPFGYSRALSPDLRSGLASLPGAQELPFVRARTVIPEGFGRRVVVGHPNYLGGFEDRTPTNVVYLTSRWSGLRDLPDDARTVALEPAVDRQAARAALEGARLLAKRLRQLPGVHIAFRPQSPVLVALAPRAGAWVAEEVGVTLLSEWYPELPGGIRIEVPQDASGDDLDRYAARVVQSIGREA